MFTGLIEKVGRLESLSRGHDGWALTIGHDHWKTPLVEGESVSVQGACLTVAGQSQSQFHCHALEETLSRTNLGSKPVGSSLNLERALRLGDRLGGHIVSGHIDGIGRVVSLGKVGLDTVLRVGCDATISREIVLKGSIAMDGVSLTVTAAGDREFQVCIIPVTWAHTSLSSLKVGDSVNLETDLIGKYVLKQRLAQEDAAELTWDHLSKAGFLL